MRLAVLSDIHGNSVGLDAVLADIEARGGADSYLVLGDVVAQGYDPAGTAERLAGLDGARFVMGNTDQWVLDLDWRGAAATAAAALGAPSRLAELETLATAGLAWTHGCLAATGWIDWLVAFPAEQRFSLPDGTRVLGAHTSPTAGGPEIEPDTPETDLVAALVGCDAELVCLGDTHIPLDRTASGIRVLNPGCIGNPRRDLGADVTATYALVSGGPAGYDAELHEVGYDHAEVIVAISKSHFAPNPGWLVAKYS